MELADPFADDDAGSAASTSAAAAATADLGAARGTPASQVRTPIP